MTTCALPGCEMQFEEKAGKKFCCKAHADRSRNEIYRTPVPPRFEHIADLRHFSKLSPSGKRAVLLGESPFSVVMFDIEATHLKPNVGRILCCSFKPMGGEPYTFEALSPRFKKADVYDDGVLARAIRDELERYDIIVGWNSKKFDIRFINARLLRVGERIKKAQPHVDGMWSWATKSAAWMGLASVQDFILPDGSFRKTKIAWPQWMRALGWDKTLREAAMAEIVDHCEKDVRVLEDVYKIMARSDVVRGLRVDGGII